MKPYRCLLAAALCAASLAAQTSQVRVVAGTPARVAQLNALGLDVATCMCTASHPGEVDLFLRDPAEWGVLLQAGFTPELVHADAEAFYASRLQQFGGARGTPPERC